MSTEAYGPPITMGQLAVRIAMGEVDVREQPPGSNRGREVDQYLRVAGLDPLRGSYPWCAAFVTWCVAVAAQRLKVKQRLRGSASVSNLLARNRALIVPAEPCSVFIHQRSDGKGHTGFVVGINGDGSFTTLEGNTDRLGSRTGGRVMYLWRGAGYASAFLRVA